MMTYAAAIRTPITSEELVSAYRPFAAFAGDLLHIHDDAAYQDAMGVLGELLDHAPEDPDSPEQGLIKTLALAIEDYESNLPEVQAWQAKVDTMPGDVAMLRLLMDQHGLGGADFEGEIGKRSYVSQILSGEKHLTRKHIEKLAARFSISPALFFD